MEEWREVAINMLPELQSEAGEAESPMSLWLEIVYKFDDAYESQERRVHQEVYAPIGVLSKKAGDGFGTSAHVCSNLFWEHIPTCKSAREDMPHGFRS